ncbi:hypothetical protein GCM10009734_43080 [Nonomuraea bangladeshensis]
MTAVVEATVILNDRSVLWAVPLAATREDLHADAALASAERGIRLPVRAPVQLFGGVLLAKAVQLPGQV